MYLLGRSLKLREDPRQEPTTLLDKDGNSADGGDVSHGYTGHEGLMASTCLYIVKCQGLGGGGWSITMRFHVDLSKADSHRNVWPEIYHGDCTVCANDPSMPLCILLPLKERPSLRRTCSLVIFKLCGRGN